MPDSSGDDGFVRCDKEKVGILAVSWQRNVLLFAGAARIIGGTNREEGTAMTCKNVTKKRKAAPTVSIFNFNSVSFDR